MEASCDDRPSCRAARRAAAPRPLRRRRPSPRSPSPRLLSPGRRRRCRPGAAARDSAVWNLPIRTYLDQTIVPIMLDGMAVRPVKSVVVSRRGRLPDGDRSTSCASHRSTQGAPRGPDPDGWPTTSATTTRTRTPTRPRARIKRRRLDEEARAAEAAKPAV